LLYLFLLKLELNIAFPCLPLKKAIILHSAPALSVSSPLGVFKPLVIIAAVMALSACTSIAPTSLTAKDLLASTQADQQAMRQNVQPITGPLTLDEALARALKYNLDRRAKMMEEALALNPSRYTQVLR
jgi:hypothetical protein